MHEAYPEILYADNHLLVVEKPPNIPVQADSSGDRDLLTQMKEYIKETRNKPGNVYLALCHRLDRPVGGVMAFACTSKAAERLSSQFRSHEVVKRYAAVVDGIPPESGQWTDYLLAREGALRVQVIPAPAEGAKEARLSYHAVARQGQRALLCICLETGRKHQIRAQCAAHGVPILYDQRYHPSPKHGQIALWAYALQFTHPTTKERISFFSLPKGEAFAPFCDALPLLPV